MTNIHHAINYVELPAADLPATRSFYEQAFGWQFNEYGPDYAGIRAPSGQGEVGGLNGTVGGLNGTVGGLNGTVGGLDGTAGGLDGTAGPDRRAPLVLLYSDDLDATVAQVRAAGGAVVVEPYEFPGGRRFHFTDPSGTELGVWSSS